jgi:predicted transposase YdaD
MKTDTLFYRLFQDRPALVFAVAGIPLPAGADYSLRAEEIKETAFRLDGLLVPGAGTEGHPLVFLEVQFQPDAAFDARWFAEIFPCLSGCHTTQTAVLEISPGNHGATTGPTHESAHEPAF